MTEPVLVNAPAGPDNRRVIKMGAIGGTLVLALLVLPKLLGGGGGGGDEVAVSPTPGATPTSIAPAPGGGGGGGGGSFSAGGGGGGGRNPFTALVSDTVPGGDGTVPAAAPTDGGLGSLPIPPVDLGSDVGGDAGGDTGAPATPATTIPPRQTHRFSLLEVYSAQTGITGARVRIDDDVIETAVGQDFGGNYRTVSLDRQSGCGVFLFGDQRITLCEGQETQT